MQCKALIVDDDPLLVMYLKLHFSDIGIEAEGAGDGIEALEKINIFEPDIILSDIMMPRMDGYDLQKQLRKNPDTENIPLIFLTTKNDISDQLTGFSMGVDDYVCKPFEIHDLVRRMQRAIKRAEQIRCFRTKADFSGNLSQIAWTDIFQLIELNRNTGELHFLSLEREYIGRTFFSNGKLVNAQMGHFEAEEAFYALMTIQEGFFEFISKTIDVSPLIKRSNSSIFLKGSRMVEEYEGLHKLLPDLNVIVKLAANKVFAEIKKNTDNQLVLKIFSLIDKKYPVGSILHSGDMSPIRAASILSDLLKRGCLEIMDDKSNGTENDSTTFPVNINKGLINIMSNIEQRLLTGILEFRNRAEPQAVFFQNGRPVHAIHGKVTGEKALFRIFREQGGPLKFLRQSVSFPFTIEKPLADLLQGGTKEIQKLQKVDKEFFTKKLTVNDQKFREISNYKNIPGLRNFIALVQGHGKVCEIIENSPLTDSFTYDQINYLLKIGILDMQEERRVIRRAVRAGFFDTRADFSGNLVKMKLVDIIHLIELNHKTGELIFKNQKGKPLGKAFFKDGNLINAHMGLLSGEEAFYGLMGKKKGYFEFYVTPVDVSQTIALPNMSVLLNGSRLIDETPLEAQKGFPDPKAQMDKGPETEGLKMFDKAILKRTISINADRLNQISQKGNHEELNWIIELVKKHEKIGDILEASRYTDLKTLKSILELNNLKVIDISEN
jgi:DNA-binding response OmpR family regulator